MNKVAPVILFVYNRPQHTREVLSALACCTLIKETELYIFADQYKEQNNKLNVAKVNEVRQLITEINFCKAVHITEQPLNMGLAESIISGVTKVIGIHGRAIILEDDIVVSKGFLQFMNDALNEYEDQREVMHISGYIYPYKQQPALKEDTFFLKILSCWGWATWDRAWNHFNPDTEKHLATLKTSQQIKDFNINGHADYYQQLLLNKEGIIHSWAVKWYSSWLNAGGISLFPGTSLVKNIGHDGTGVHCTESDLFSGVTTSFIQVSKKAVAENLKVRKSIDNFYKIVFPKSSVLGTIKRAAKKLIAGK